MSHLHWISALALAGVAAACGNEIGDECTSSVDCSSTGDRTCDTASAGGYCIIQGCDATSCPEEAACIRFYTGSFANLTCDPVTEDVSTDMCSVDERCALDGHCVARASETRYCMKRCGDNGDCRDGYECRGIELMIAHGGEPVLGAGQIVSDTSPKFCAQAPSD